MFLNKLCQPPLAGFHFSLLFLPLAVMSIDENQKVFQGTPSEDVRLENLGYEQGMSKEERYFVLRD